MQLSTLLTYPLMLTKWSAILNPVIANPLNNVSILSDVVLKSGVNNINHLLSRDPQGWFLDDIQGAATIYRSAAYNNKILQLTSNAAVTVSIGVF